MVAFNIFKPKKIQENSLMSEMTVEIGVNEESGVLVFHDKAFESPVNRIDYDPDNGAMIFVSEDGTSRPLGMSVPKRTRKKMETADLAKLCQMKGVKEIVGYSEVAITQIATSV